MEDLQDIKVSIILPVYNAGKHLYKCLDSLVNQTLQGIEIIAILDCPTDGSDKVVEEYAKKYSQIKIIKNSQNLHIGNSRNKGLEIAKGKYIGFCDHDDYADLQMYEKLYDIMEKENVDMVVSPYILMQNGKIINHKTYPTISSEQLSKEIHLTAIGIKNKNDILSSYLMCGEIWNKLFKANIIKENKISFVDTKLCFAEDLAFLIEYTYYCKKAGICYDDLYFHIKHENNTVTSYGYNSPSKILGYISYIIRYLSNSGEINNTDIVNRFYKSIQVMVMRAVTYEIKNNVTGLYKVLQLFRKQVPIHIAFQQYSQSDSIQTLKQKILFFLLKIYL